MIKLLPVAATAAAVAVSLAAGAAASAPPLDEQWLQTAISGDRFEIAGGKIALQRSTNPQVRALAQRLIQDHSKSLRETTAVAHRWAVGVPPAAQPSLQWELHNLRFMPRSRFDAEYASLEVKDHEQDIAEAGMEAREGAAFEFRQLALKELPKLNAHLDLARKAVAAVNAGHAH